MKNVSESSREHAMKLINFKKKNMKLLRNKQLKSYENAKIYDICKEMFEDKYSKDTKQNIIGLEIIAITQMNIGVLHMFWQEGDLIFYKRIRS